MFLVTFGVDLALASHVEPAAFTRVGQVVWGRLDRGYLYALNLTGPCSVVITTHQSSSIVSRNALQPDRL